MNQHAWNSFVWMAKCTPRMWSGWAVDSKLEWHIKCEPSKTLVSQKFLIDDSKVWKTFQKPFDNLHNQLLCIPNGKQKFFQPIAECSRNDFLCKWVVFTLLLKQNCAAETLTLTQAAGNKQLQKCAFANLFCACKTSKQWLQNGIARKQFLFCLKRMIASQKVNLIVFQFCNVTLWKKMFSSSANSKPCMCDAFWTSFFTIALQCWTIAVTWTVFSLQAKTDNFAKLTFSNFSKLSKKQNQNIFPSNEFCSSCKIQMRNHKQSMRWGLEK